MTFCELTRDLILSNENTAMLNVGSSYITNALVVDKIDKVQNLLVSTVNKDSLLNVCEIIYRDGQQFVVVAHAFSITTRVKGNMLIVRTHEQTKFVKENVIENLSYVQTGDNK